MKDLLRTHDCGTLRQEHHNLEVRLCGWVHRIRHLGAITLVDLRDPYGITQLQLTKNSQRELCDSQT